MIIYVADNFTIFKNKIIDEENGRKKPKLSQINVFTDGSKTRHGVGAGYIIMKGKTRYFSQNV